MALPSVVGDLPDRLARLVPERFLRAERLLPAVPLDERAVRPKLPRLDVVGEERVQDPAEPRAVLRIHHGHDQLDAPVEVARHPVGAPDEDLRVAAVSELEDAGVLEEAVDDRHHPDVLAQSLYPWPKQARSTDVEVDPDARLRRLVERIGQG